MRKSTRIIIASIACDGAMVAMLFMDQIAFCAIAAYAAGALMATAQKADDIEELNTRIEGLERIARIRELQAKQRSAWWAQRKGDA